jgi:hypothetical protein
LSSPARYQKTHFLVTIVSNNKFLSSPPSIIFKFKFVCRNRGGNCHLVVACLPAGWPDSKTSTSNPLSLKICGFPAVNTIVPDAGACLRGVWNRYRVAAPAGSWNAFPISRVICAL